MISVKPFAALQKDILHIKLDETFPFYGTCGCARRKEKMFLPKERTGCIILTNRRITV
jgi:hypothetical protein